MLFRLNILSVALNDDDWRCQCEEAIPQNSLQQLAAKQTAQLNETKTLLSENLTAAHMMNIESQIILDIHGNYRNE